MTSGHVLVYDRSGKLLFSGVSPGRGGRKEKTPGVMPIGIVAGKVNRLGTNVFGCPLFEASDKPVRERAACPR
jgi:hypothetical protein